MRITSLLSVLSAIALLGAGCLPSAPATVEDGAPGPSLGMWAEPNGIVVSDQRPGMTVTISAIIIENGGWIVIHKEAAGKPGTVIGEARLVAGESSQIKVSLREATIEGMGYYAMLHTDDGDGRFDIAKDAPVRSTMLDGTIMARFEASVEAGEPPVVNP